MGKRQTRRSYSVRAEVSASITKHCRDRDVTPTSFVEAAIITALTAAGSTMVTREEALGEIKSNTVAPAMMEF